MEQSPKPEEKYKDFEKQLEETYLEMGNTRTVLKSETKRSRGHPPTWAREDFYKAFVHLYGLVFQRINTEKGENRKLIRDINNWDETFNLHREGSPESVKVGIRLSEKLQEAIKKAGFIG